MPTTHGPKFTQEASTGASFTLSWVKRRFGSEPPKKSSKRMSWDPKQPFINGTFNWMIPNLLIKHPFQTACLKFHIPKTSPKNNVQNKCQNRLSTRFIIPKPQARSLILFRIVPLAKFGESSQSIRGNQNTNNTKNAQNPIKYIPIKPMTRCYSTTHPK